MTAKKPRTALTLKPINMATGIVRDESLVSSTIEHVNELESIKEIKVQTHMYGAVESKQSGEGI
jgi:hypothetical protein